MLNFILILFFCTFYLYIVLFIVYVPVVWFELIIDNINHGCLATVKCKRQIEISCVLKSLISKIKDDVIVDAVD